MIVASPNVLHVAMALDCVERGIPALVEKPVADTVVSARRLCNAVQRSGVPVLVGHHRRHNPIIKTVREQIAGGLIGQLTAVVGLWLLKKPDDYFDVAWRRERGGGPILINLIHDIDNLRFICGEIAEVQALTSNKVRGFAVEDTAALLLRFANGAIGTVTVSDATPAPWSWELASGENAAYPEAGPALLPLRRDQRLAVRTHHADVVLSRRERMVRAAGARRRGHWCARSAGRAAQAFPCRHRPPRDAIDFGRGCHGHPCRRGSRKRSGANRDPGFAGPDHGAGRMNKRSIATVSLSGPLDEKLRAIAAAGFDTVEIFENDLLSFGASPREVGQRCRDLGLSICAFQPFRDFEGMPEPQRARGFARAERKFDLMQELQTDLLLICSSVSPVSLGGIDRAAADFRELGELAARRGLRVGYEALAWGRHVSDHRDAWEIVRRADHKSIGLILDSFHTLAPKLPTGSIRSIPADKIFLVQLADAPKLELDILSWSRHFRCFPGQGDLPVREFMEAVAATGYAGPLSLEIFNDQFRAGAATRTAIDGMRSLLLLQDQLAAARPDGALAPKARSHGVGFIEFAVNETKADSARRAVRPARVSQDRAAPQQGGRAVVAGRNRTRHQLRERRLCAFALRHPWARCLRHCARRRQRRPRHGPRRGTEDADLLTAGRTG